MNSLYLLDNGLLLVETFFWSWLEFATGWSAKFTWDLLTFSFWGVLLDVLLLGLANLLGPLGTLLLSGVSLSHILALLLLDGLTFNYVILDIVLMVSGLTLRLVDSLTFFWTFTLANQWSVAELDLLIRGNLLVLNETLLDKVLLAFLLLLWLEVSGVSGVASLAVAVLASDHVIEFSLLNHHNLVNATFTSSGNGSNVQSNFVIGSLTRVSGWSIESRQPALSMMSMMSMIPMVVSMMIIVSLSCTSSASEWEDTSQALLTPWLVSRGAGEQQKEAKLKYKKAKIIKRKSANLLCLEPTFPNPFMVIKVEPTGVTTTSTAQEILLMLLQLSMALYSGCLEAHFSRILRRFCAPLETAFLI